MEVELVYMKVCDKRETLIQKIREFRLLDDDFMSKVFEDDIECTELVLHIIMDKQVYHVDRIMKETMLPFGDGAHIIYVNGPY